MSDTERQFFDGPLLFREPEIKTGPARTDPTPFVPWPAPDVAAEVTPVQITRYQWDNITSILRTLADLHDSMEGRGLAGALVQGDLIADAARQAKEIEHLCLTTERR